MDTDLVASRMAALGNRTRLAAYRHLVRAGEPGLSVAAVQERLEIPASTLSHHLRRLCDVGLVQQERRGTTLLCRADYDVMGATFEWLADECCVDAARTGATSTCGTSRTKSRTSAR
ncbi:Helix-turn-helix domain protein [Planctomycetes bacterium Pla163]|uniref:Helix-turn-helix domain protein n=1 Tax=Rohdeia mirabilis TaxID=2528008 RepID=A0A518CX12_9BACT|nr:Helix-turn-helix domain protein [Planctomycetes bacterium Pla163]